MTITAEQARELLDGATPGPWYRDAWDIRANHPGTGAICEVARPNGDDDQYWQDGEADANARLIAAAPDLARAYIAQAEELARVKADLAKAVEALEWYGEQARLARLIHSEGDPGRHALEADGGKRARATLSEITHD